MNAAEMYEKRIKKFLDDVDRREKSIERSLDFAWENIQQKDANEAILKWNMNDIHDYGVILNELQLVRRELESILADVEAEREATTPDGWYKG